MAHHRTQVRWSPTALTAATYRIASTASLRVPPRLLSCSDVIFGTYRRTPSRIGGPSHRGAARPGHRCCPRPRLSRPPPRRPCRPGWPRSTGPGAAVRPPGRPGRPAQPAASPVPSPAHDTRLASSNTASTVRPACNNRTCEVSSRPGSWLSQQLPFSLAQRAPSSYRRAQIPNLIGGSRLRACLGW
jgi:hypothetical protein